MDLRGKSARHARHQKRRPTSPKNTARAAAANDRAEPPDERTVLAARVAAKRRTAKGAGEARVAQQCRKLSSAPTRDERDARSSPLVDMRARTTAEAQRAATARA